MKTIGLVLLLAVVATVWASYYALGTSVRWQDAYRAMEVTEGGPHAVAQAMAENEPPEGLPLDRRLHTSGSLVKVRYEHLDQAGKVMATYEVRALVPELPYFGPNNCPAPCRERLQAANATLIERSGQAGLATEWLLRMPIGKSFSLGQRSLEIQDMGQKRSRSIPRGAMRATLLAACKAQVRIGESTKLDYSSDAVVPILKGFVTRRWVQLEGCQALMRTAPAAELSGPEQPWEKPQPRFRNSWPGSMAAFEAVYPRQPAGQEMGLYVDEAWVAKHGRPLEFHLLRACHFDRSGARWIELPGPDEGREIAAILPPASTLRVAHHFPELNALIFAEWVERWQDRSEHRHRLLLPSRNTTCRDNDLPAPERGQVVACVPDGMTSETMLVPDPETLCGTDKMAARKAAPALRQ